MKLIIKLISILGTKKLLLLILSMLELIAKRTDNTIDDEAIVKIKNILYDATDDITDIRH